jgi:hypothetical protein
MHLLVNQTAPLPYHRHLVRAAYAAIRTLRLLPRICQHLVCVATKEIASEWNTTRYASDLAREARV